MLATELDGKKFNASKDHRGDGEYGKCVFAEKIVRPNADTINFSGFAPLLDRIIAVLDDYSQPASDSKESGSGRRISGIIRDEDGAGHAQASG